MIREADKDEDQEAAGTQSCRESSCFVITINIIIIISIFVIDNTIIIITYY